MNINLECVKALIFDCDNTLALTMPSHKKAYELAFNLNEVTFQSQIFDYYAPLGGEVFRNAMIGKYMSEEVWEQIVKDKKEMLPATLRKYMKPNNELLKLIDEARPKNIKIAVVSNGRNHNIRTILDMLDIYPNVIICKEDVNRAKPHPDPYIITLYRLGLKPNEVIVFEDNEIGINSAKAAGITNIIEVKI